MTLEEIINITEKWIESLEENLDDYNKIKKEASCESKEWYHEGQCDAIEPIINDLRSLVGALQNIT